MRIRAPVGRRGEVVLSYVCRHCHRFPIEDYIWWVPTRPVQVVVRGVRRPDQFWKNPNRVLVIQDSTDRSGPKDVSGPRSAAGRA